ncbi:hypothetical protein NXS19_003102 [Fusarium pseudograminearum]|nr:hypothetical protein NXS19_003102 [Fusarium pseudograminearum]
MSSSYWIYFALSSSPPCPLVEYLPKKHLNHHYLPWTQGKYLAYTGHSQRKCSFVLGLPHLPQTLTSTFTTNPSFLQVQTDSLTRVESVTHSSALAVEPPIQRLWRHKLDP